MWHILFRIVSGLLAVGLLLAVSFISYWAFFSELQLRGDDIFMIPIALGAGICNLILFTLITFNRYRKGVAAFFAWWLSPWFILLAAESFRMMNSPRKVDAALDIPVEGIVLGGMVLVVLFVIGLVGRKAWFSELLLLVSIGCALSVYFVWESEYTQYSRERSALETFVYDKEMLRTGTQYQSKVCIPPLAEITDRLIDERIQYETQKLAPLLAFLPDDPPIDRFLPVLKQQAKHHGIEIIDLSVKPKMDLEFITAIGVTGTVMTDMQKYQQFLQDMSNGDWIVEWEAPDLNQKDGIQFIAKLYGYSAERTAMKKEPGMCARGMSRVWLPPYSWRLHQQGKAADQVCAGLKQYEAAYNKLQHYQQFRRDVLGRAEVFNILKEATTSERIKNYKIDVSIPCL